MKAGFVEEARYTTWLANVVLVKKQNGKWRMCVDYTNLNKACPRDAYLLPNIDRLVDGAAGSGTLSFLDAYSGYNQIPMAEDDAIKTAFITEEANLYYKVMPFGLKNAGATYQRLMDKVFKPLLGNNVEVYVDDIVVQSPNPIQHALDLTEVFKATRGYNLRLNPEKCTFGVDGGKFLGYMLTRRGIEANPEKCQAIISMRSPANVKEVQRLVGRLTAISRFLPKLAEKTKPMINLLKKSSKFEWSVACQENFDQLKLLLATPPILNKPRPGPPLLIYIAASSNAVSAALVQEFNDTQQPIYFTSRILQDPETRYQMVEKIALALITAARRLRPYFQTHPIIVKTDYPIQKILQKPDLAGRLSSWSIELSEFSIKYEPHDPIKAQCLADFTNDLQPQEPTHEWWIMHVDGSSNTKGAGAGIVLEGPSGILIEQSLCFAFKTSNNQAEYEAIVAGLHLALEMEVKRLSCKTDSKLTVGHLTGQYQVKDDLLS